MKVMDLDFRFLLNQKTLTMTDDKLHHMQIVEILGERLQFAVPPMNYSDSQTQDGASLYSACPSNTHNYNCSGICNCTDAHTNNPTQTCNSKTGNCDCLPTWTGSRCETDVNECALGTDNCASTQNTECDNIDGGFECNCLPGYEKNDQGACEGNFINYFLIEKTHFMSYF